MAVQYAKFLTIADMNDACKGRYVLYTDWDGITEGRIKTWNSEYVFVVYACNGQWDRYEEYTAEATSPGKLLWA